MKGNATMKQFNANDAEGIAEYVKSLDLFDQFDEITVDLLRRDSIDDKRVHEVRITIKSLDRVIYRVQKHRDFAEEIFEFSKFFEQDIKFLSSAVLFLRRLLEIDKSLTNFRFEFKDFWVSATASNEISSFELDALVNSDNEPVASVSYEFELETRLMNSKHSFKTKSAIKIDELSDVVATLSSES